MNEEPPPTPKPAPAGPAGASPNPYEGDASLSNVLKELLKKPMGLVSAFEEGELGKKLPTRLLLIAVISLTLFGFVVGGFSGGTQLWAAPLKIVAGCLFSALICLPSLYIFTCLGGIEAKFRTVFGILCAMTALTALLLVGFAPVVWLFSVSSEQIGFMGFLVTTLWIVCAGFGLVLVQRAGKAMGMTKPGYLNVWCGVFFLVTLQMPTTLRPIIGESDRFLNTEEKRFFLQHWGEVLGGGDLYGPRRVESIGVNRGEK